MAVTTNAQEKQELFKTIWKIADDLRGKVDGWDFKAYVLGTLFYRYLSENIADRINKQEREAGDTEFDYASLTDDDVKGVEGFREELIKEIGFFLYPSQLFCNVVENASKDENLNMTLEKVFCSIEESAKGSDSEKCFSGLFSDFDVNSNKLGATVPKRNETLVKLLTSVKDMDFGSYTDNTVDLLGDAYEFLMGMYASNAGRSGGEYFTPQEVSTLLTKLAIIGKDRVNKVYDPACGSGSLLLKSAKILGKDKVDQGYFGQELNVTTYNLCRINMFLHNIGYDKFDIANEDTLTQPMHWDEEPFEVIVSNPPYSTNWVGDEDVTLINDPRYSPAGVLAPNTRADMAFVMHMISWLAPNGTAAIVCFPGIMYRGGAEQKIRKYLVDNNFIDAIIQLPSNLFFGTSIATCIMIMKKNKSDNNILFIDAEKECIKDGNSNRLTDNNIENIIRYYSERVNVEHAVSLVSYDKILTEKYNLSVATYVKKKNTREKIDIKQVNGNIKSIVENINRLRCEINGIIADLEGDGAASKIEELISQKCPEGVEFYPIGEVCTVVRGASPRPIKNFITNDADGVNWIKIGDVAAGSKYITSCAEKITMEGAKKSRFVKKGDFILSNSMSFGRPYILELDGCIHDGWLSISDFEDKMIADYLYYILVSGEIQREMEHRASFGGAVQNLNADIVRAIEIPVPPICVQQEIIHILDKFTELEAELQSELETSKKQYEYYRDKLLSFERKEV